MFNNIKQGNSVPEERNTYSGTLYIVTCMSVTTDGFGIDDSIYCTL
jgi:hypothetical protein